ncbi:MAG: hypothetical protein E7220_06395 [Clostridiales bacterium]|nr:hypothetical protein [Clostridiales bacterium]
MKNSSKAAKQKQDNRKKQSGTASQKSSIEKAANRKPDQEILYQIVTQRDSGILLAYITFTYRVFHPRVTARMVLYGLLIFAPGFIVKAQALKIILWVIGALVVLLGLFRQYISLAITKNSDEDYRNGTIFAYEFTQNDAAFYRDGEMISYSRNYKDIDAIFYDENYYYISYKNREFFVIPMDKFTIGDPATFDDFMYKKCKKVCHWIPVKFSNKIKKIRSQRAIAREQLKK